LTLSGVHAVPGRRSSRPFFAKVRTALAELDVVYDLVVTKWPVVGGEDLFIGERHQDPWPVQAEVIVRRDPRF